MKDKICSALKFLIRFFHLVLITLTGKAGSEKKKCRCVSENKESAESYEKTESEIE
jgi:hypothetical protein